MNTLIAKRAMRNLFLATSSVALSLQPFLVSAQNVDRDPKVAVRQTNSINGMPVFQVLVDNADAQWYELSISDMNGVVLYTETINAASYSKRFQIEEPAAENLEVVVQPLRRKGKRTHTFLVSNPGFTGSDIVVSKL
jgi:hypothetical protein